MAGSAVLTFPSGNVLSLTMSESLVKNSLPHLIALAKIVSKLLPRLHMALYEFIKISDIIMS